MLEQLSIQQRFRVLLIFTLACFALCAGVGSIAFGLFYGYRLIR